MTVQKFKTLNGKIYYLFTECFTLLDCGDGYFYVNEIKITRSHNVQNLDPYYEFLGAIVRRESYGYQAVTSNMTPPFEFRENAWYGMAFVHVPKNMNEWLGYWTGEDWILVAMPASENIQPGESPEITRSKELPAPTNQVSFVLFAESGKFYVVQAFDKRGTPLIMFLEDVPPDFPFPVLPRNVLPVERSSGSIYAFDYDTWFTIVN